MPKAPPRLDPDDPAQGLALEMRRLRLRAGSPSLAELAREMSCSHSTVSAYLNGHRLPPIGQLARFAVVCGDDPEAWRRKLEDVHERLNRLPPSGGSGSSVAEHQFDVSEGEGDDRVEQLWPSTDAVAEQQIRPPKVWESVPIRNRNFTGRLALLRHVHESILAASEAGRSLALYGPAGVGKTQIAIEYTHRYSTGYDFVGWIPSSDRSMARSAMAGLAIRLGWQPAKAGGIDSFTEALVEALRDGDPYARWLLVFDQADQPEDIADLIPGGPGHTLISSCNPKWREIADAAEVGLFNRPESTAFLNRRTGSAIRNGDADLLAEKLGDLPLALEQAGAMLSETGMPPAEYVKILSARPVMLLDEGKPPDYQEPMSRATRTALARLEEAEPNASMVLRCFALLGPEPLPLERILSQESPPNRPPPGAPPLLNDLLADPSCLKRALDQIERFGLARIDPNRETIQVHLLVQAILRDDPVTAEEAAFRHGALSLLTRAIPDNTGDTTAWPWLTRLAAHIGPAQLLESSDPYVRERVLTIIRLLLLSGDYTASRALAETALRQWTADSGQDDPQVLLVQSFLADVLREIGQYRAADDIAQHVLQRAQQIFGAEHEASVHLAIGSASYQRARGHFREALQHDMDSVRLCNTVFGTSSPLSHRAANDLALDLELTGDYVAARDLYLDKIRDLRSAAKVDAVISRIGASRATRLVGAYEEARVLAEQAYDSSHRDLGPSHRWTLRAATELSIARRYVGDYTGMLNLANGLSEPFRHVLGDRHPDTLAAELCMANALRATGRIDQSIAMTEDIAVRALNIYGTDHPYNDSINGNLALLRRFTGDPTGAYDLNRTSCMNLERMLGDTHYHTLIVTANLASDLAALGDLPQARQLGETVVHRSRESLGNIHPMTLRCAYNLSLDRSVDTPITSTAPKPETLISYLAKTIGSGHPEIETMKKGNRINFDFDLPPTLY